jgi:3-hydroxyisobutyrate dehydrogenase-like beta-hydroxyacid dehydrogenase
MATVGLLHPGEMGAAVGGCLVSVGHEVLWDPAGRSRASTGRAFAAGLTGVSFSQLIARSEVILSICPPHAAREVAHQVADAGYTGCYVDANAVSTETAGQVSAIVTATGATYVDGGIIGNPPETAGHTRLYLSGPQAAEIRALFNRSRLDARVAEGPLYAASAVKMAYAAWTKGSSALLLAAQALARANGVEDTLLAEWGMSQQGLGQRVERAAAAAAAKGWRWTGEMEEIAASMAAVGLPPGFHEAAAEIYERTSRAGAPAARRPAAAEPAATVETVLSALM